MILRQTFWGVLFILIGSGVGFVLTQQGIFLRIFYLCALLILVGWIWAFISVRGLSFHRSAPVTRMQLGDVFEEQYFE